MRNVNQLFPIDFFYIYSIYVSSIPPIFLFPIRKIPTLKEMLLYMLYKLSFYDYIIDYIQVCGYFL